MTECEAPALWAKTNAALRRAIPVTRLVDYGVALGDALTVHARTSGDGPQPWHTVCEALADGHVQAASAGAAHASALTCAQEWRHAAALYQAAHLAFNDDTPEKARLYELGRNAFREAGLLATVSAQVSLKELRLASDQGELYGWVVEPVGTPAHAAVIVIGGMSGWGSVYLGMARSLARRGMLCLLAEGPGQGATRLASGVHLSGATFALFGRFIDHAHAMGATRLGVWGNSFGGLFAARLAATDARVGAVCINGAPMAPAVPEFRMAREQMRAMFGLPGDDGLEGQLAALGLDKAQHRIDAPMLVVEGGRDPLVPMGQQHEFLALARGPSRVMAWADGEHTIYNHAEQRNARVADWFLEALKTH